MDESFQTLRRYAREHSRRLVDVAQDLIDGAAHIGAIGALATWSTPANPPGGPAEVARPAEWI